MFEVTVYDIYNNTHSFRVESKEKGREYAKRIITEGLWLAEGEHLEEGEVFYPVHSVVKVKVCVVLDKQK